MPTSLRRSGILAVLGLVAAAAAVRADGDLRRLVDLTVARSFDFPADEERLHVQVFRDGSFHYDDSFVLDRSECDRRYTFALGKSTAAQLATLDRALTDAHLATQHGGCAISSDFSGTASYRVQWTGRNGDRSNDITFTATPDPSVPRCDAALATVPKAILEFARVVMTLRATRTIKGAECYPLR